MGRVGSERAVFGVIGVPGFLSLGLGRDETKRTAGSYRN